MARKRARASLQQGTATILFRDHHSPHTDTAMESLPSQDSPKHPSGRRVRHCRICGVPQKGHACPYKDERRSYAVADADDRHHEPMFRAGSKVYNCQLCGVPKKGHVCPQRRETNSSEYVRSTAVGHTVNGNAKPSQKRRRLSLLEQLPFCDQASEKNGTTVAADILPRPARIYQCTRCHVPLKGHVCPYKHPSISFQSKPPASFARPAARQESTDWESDSDGNEEKLSLVHHLSSAPNDKLSDEASLSSSSSSEILGMPMSGKGSDDDESFSDRPSRTKTNSFRKSPARYANGKKVRLCFRCGVPRRGHTCPYASHNREKSLYRNEWTEAMAPGHVLYDQVCAYIDRQGHGLADHDRAFLIQWAGNVNSSLFEEDKLIWENIELVLERRRQSKATRKQQDTLIRMQSSIRHIQSTIKQLEERIAMQRHETNKRRSASRFLDALERIQGRNKTSTA
ncbi:predicted protein [Phaeodactylum tricornutum CCAP 1055/1]|uniref:Uncharacterized protein n=1 Tax=Phaeodactylum tricornutum (strain CCAP 1055/1) TaxID=556484 RepID=B7GDK5_PHATC|nr:predicted protein [Phaeodactylum tricornutum CCAP 1055/1]EEC43277.1 predicted protein [Phaeodactylum tricornutum CCAP 1055/1]|eukprot:XP_002185145.1 predicted protein [Phaeodactylum tricornutum CCAP 1055/1]